jgi:hypothetical protein
MSDKSVTLNRSAAAQLAERKHSQRYLDQEEEPETETKEANLWLLGPERRAASSGFNMLANNLEM